MQLNEKGKRVDGKRGRGYILNCKTLKHAYIAYKELSEKKDFKAVEKRIYTKVCKDFNKTMMSLILDKSDEVTLPFRLGKLSVVKKEKNFNRIYSNKMPVDWKKTKELGYRVYHLEKHIYQLYWNRRDCVVKFKTAYKFKGCRKAVRKIAENIKVKKLDYFTYDSR